MSYNKKHDAQEVTSLSGGTIYSGSTDLSTYFSTNFSSGGGAGLLTTYSLSAIESSTASADNVLALRFLCYANIEINSMGLFVSSASSDEITLGVYSDAGSLLTDSGAVSTASWTTGDIVDVPVTTLQLQSGEVYWLAIKGKTGSLNFGTKASLANANLCKAQYFAGTGLPTTLAGSANGVAPFIYIKD